MRVDVRVIVCCTLWVRVRVEVKFIVFCAGRAMVDVRVIVC